MKNNTISFVVIILLLSIASVCSLNLFLRQRAAFDKLDIHSFPYQIGDWQGTDIRLGDYVFEILETKNLILREYANPQGEVFTLFIVYSETNRSVFHPPEVCLMGGGIKLADKQREEITAGNIKFFTNKLYLEKDDYRGIALYSYKAGNLYTENFYLQQIYFALSQLFGQQKGGATIRVSTQINNQDKLTALNNLKSFLAQTVAIVDSLSVD
ncbi:exosortase C-terminal domain/associated protein EpsI [Candidatus Omnitrophota bacterium]